MVSYAPSTLREEEDDDEEEEEEEKKKTKGSKIFCVFCAKKKKKKMVLVWSGTPKVHFQVHITDEQKNKRRRLNAATSACALSSRVALREKVIATPNG
jgi:microsomal dipeptidase-like Zn-dependent dipeptidase